MGSEVQLGAFGLSAGSWGSDGGRRASSGVQPTDTGSPGGSQCLFARYSVLLAPLGDSDCWVWGRAGGFWGAGEVQLGALKVRMVEGGSAWQLLGSERWAQARSGASWGPADEHEPHTGAGTAGSPGRPRAAPSGSAPRGSSSPSPPPPAPSGLPRPPLPAPAGAEGRSGHGRRRRRRQRWVSARGARRSGTRRDRTCPERRGRQRGRGGGGATGGCSGKGGSPEARGLPGSGAPGRALLESSTGALNRRGSASQSGSGPGALSLCHPSSPLKAR